MTLSEELNASSPSMETLLWSMKCDSVIASEEGLKEVWEATKKRVLEICNHQETMLHNLQELIDRDVFGHLDDDKLVKAVLPKDLQLVVDALHETNQLLSKLREGAVLRLEEHIGSEFSDVGVELREDGIVHMDKFAVGNWGMGKGKSNVHAPLEFRKTVEEVNWKANGQRIVEQLIGELAAVPKSKLLTSIDLHYKTLVRSVYSKQEKTDVKSDKRILVRQIKNMIAVRNTLVKFAYRQIKHVVKAYVPPKEGTAGSNSVAHQDEY